jgi:hypothetical protein
MANKGFFLITDISGYTEYLTKSELEHANLALQNLFDAQLQQIKFPMHISGFRGDAILIYIPESELIKPQSFLEMMENLYIVFSETLRQMAINSTCPCKACKNMNLLDLKMCVHYGEYIIQRLGDKEELLGTDVIVPHRMLKNHVIEKTGISAYAIFSEAAANKLNLASLCDPLISHHETYEHLGDVRLYVHDLHAAWEKHLNSARHVVNPDTAWIKIEIEIPFPPPLIWDYITTPELEASILGLISVTRNDDLGGRTGPGSKFHCAHSSGDFFNKVVDWKPFKYYTVQQTAAGLEYHRTIRMDYDGTTTKFGVYVSQPDKEAPEGFRDFLEMAARQGYERITPTMQADVETGKILTT